MLIFAEYALQFLLLWRAWLDIIMRPLHRLTFITCGQVMGVLHWLPSDAEGFQSVARVADDYMHPCMRKLTFYCLPAGDACAGDCRVHPGVPVRGAHGRELASLVTACALWLVLGGCCTHQSNGCVGL